MKKILPILILILTASLSGSAGDVDYSSQVQPGKWLRNVMVKTEYMGETSSAKIQIYFPKSYTKGQKLRTIIALHQYANNEKDWESGALIESQANKYNMVIVCPDMDKSVYETNYYPETTYKWNVIPGGKFLGETLIKFLNDNFSLALKKESTGIAGVIAGAHGATTADQAVTLQPVYCLGLCACAPAMAIDGQVHGRVQVADLERLLGRIQEAV